MSKLTKLEEDIERAILESGESAYPPAIKAAAEVAKKYIEKALEDASAETFGSWKKVQALYIEKWLIENGISPPRSGELFNGYSAIPLESLELPN